ncbi:MAG TPA: folylpolyglutamate synthase/dihydrofolate synthase family protein [Thermoanaerobaculia bacterium]|nr:folylpolyglutamate synthase/dihydrofolate synthase family protein [Thermoanaerobaculia bacterium]
MWGQRLGLERIRGLLERLASPELAVPTVLVAGTNGKGSTATFLSSILRASGARVGLYTSPHLESVQERIRVDGVAIEAEPLLAALSRVLEAAPEDGERPTYFEALTAAAFLHFASARVDVTVAEVGLGGRLDATNSSQPALSVITAIGYDHEEHLGSRLAQIAREKAGILRPGRQALACAANDEVREALLRAAGEAGSDLRFVEDEVTVAVLGPSASGERWDFHLRTPEAEYEVHSRLRGRHQAINLALAVRAAEQLRTLRLARIDRVSVEAGVDRACWPGRLETVDLPGGGRVLLDGAHNEGGVVALADYLRSVVAPAGRDLLFGALQGKRAESTLRLLVPMFERVTLTEPPSPKALPAEELEGSAPGAAVRPRVADALGAALEGGGQRELVVCGSLYLVGAVRMLLRQRFGVPVAAAALATG